MEIKKLLSAYHYDLPDALIAHEPANRRDASRLLVVDRLSGVREDLHFNDLVDLLTDKDVLVFNQSRVFPARLFGHKKTGGKVEVLLIKKLDEEGTWEAITRPGLREGAELVFTEEFHGIVKARDLKEQTTMIQFNQTGVVLTTWLEKIGEVPIPPYIHTRLDQAVLKERYQTIYAKKTGSAAAPTAGLHFTDDLLKKLSQSGVQLEYVTLHVGLGTFRPIQEENMAKNRLHKEFYEIDLSVADRLLTAKEKGKRIVAVGTTTTRTLEAAYQQGSFLIGPQVTEIFIHPPYKFSFVDSMITNFHLPESSLLMLVSAFVSEPNTSIPFTDFSSSVIGKAYEHAIQERYRFYSFGDAMFVTELEGRG